MVIQVDKETTLSVTKTLQKADKVHDELAATIYQIIDVQDTWDGAISKINDVMTKKAEEAGFSRQKTRKFQFCEFEFATSKKTQNPNACQECLKNLFCSVHTLKKKKLITSNTLIDNTINSITQMSDESFGAF